MVLVDLGRSLLILDLVDLDRVDLDWCWVVMVTLAGEIERVPDERHAHP